MMSTCHALEPLQPTPLAPQEGKYQQSTACASFGNEKRKNRKKATISSRIKFKNTISLQWCPHVTHWNRCNCHRRHRRRGNTNNQLHANLLGNEKQKTENATISGGRNTHHLLEHDWNMTAATASTAGGWRYQQSTAYGDIREDQFHVILRNKKRKTKKQ